MALIELLKEQLGVKTSYNINPEVNSVAVTVTKILSYNPNRVGFVFFNAGANDIYISPHNDVASSKGILISGGGGGVSFSWREDFELVASEWFAIASGGASNVYLHEIVIL